MNKIITLCLLALAPLTHAKIMLRRVSQLSRLTVHPSVSVCVITKTKPTQSAQSSR